MEDWVARALAKWPDVPALYGWLSLDRRGQWRIRGELISRPQIIDTINRNYAADARGCWYFQNGPQRGYVELEATPLILRVTPDDGLVTHHGRAVEAPTAVWLDETGALLLATEHGPGQLAGPDLGWALDRLLQDGRPADEAALAAALALPSGTPTALRLDWQGQHWTLRRLDDAAAPAALGFVRTPQAGIAP